MAATGTRPPASFTGRSTRGERPRDPASSRRAPAALGAALAIAVAYAMFASGAIVLPEESVLQVGVAATAFGALAGLLFGRGLRVAAAPLAGPGIVLLAAFAAWSGLSIAWSIAPDESWIELNRAIAYTLVAGLALTLGSSLPRAAERVALGYLAIATVVALYALGGKLFPGLEIAGLIDLNQTERFSRLRAPLGYANALALACVLAVPLAVRAAAELDYPRRARLLALVALVPILTTLVLTYSRGGLLVLVLALGLQIALGPERLRLLVTGGIGVAGALPPVLFALTRDDFSTDGLSVSDRADDGLLLTLAVALGVAIAVVLGRALIRSGDRLRLGPSAVLRARRLVAAAAVIVSLGGFVALAASDRGIGGTISHELDEFSEPKFDPQNDPARILRTNSGNRYVWWEEAVGAFSDRPLVGHGAGSFPLLHRLYRDDAIDVRQPHSVPLEFLSETGLVGAALALGGLALLGIAATRATLARVPGRQRGFAAALLAGAGVWGAHAVIDWDWDIPAVSLPMLIFLGVLAARPPGTRRADRLPRGAAGGRRGLALTLGALAAVVVIALAALPAIARELSSQALSDAADGTAEGLLEGGEKAALAKRLNPFAVDAVFAQASIAERGSQTADAAAELLVEAVERQPDNPSTWLRLARFQLLVDDTRGAQRSLRTAFSLDRAGLVLRLLAGYELYDERRSASATGTPLPELVRVPGPVARPPAPRPRAPRVPQGQPAPTPTPSPAPTPPPAPAPPPTPPPAPPREPASPPPGGEPFRLEG